MDVGTPHFHFLSKLLLEAGCGAGVAYEAQEASDQELGWTDANRKTPADSICFNQLLLKLCNDYFLSNHKEKWLLAEEMAEI